MRGGANTDLDPDFVGRGAALTALTAMTLGDSMAAQPGTLVRVFDLVEARVRVRRLLVRGRGRALDCALSDERASLSEFGGHGVNRGENHRVVKIHVAGIIIFGHYSAVRRVYDGNLSIFLLVKLLHAFGK